MQTLYGMFVSQPKSSNVTAELNAQIITVSLSDLYLFSLHLDFLKRYFDCCNIRIFADLSQFFQNPLPWQMAKKFVMK